jgi:hypothetical protein
MSRAAENVVDYLALKGKLEEVLANLDSSKRSLQDKSVQLDQAIVTLQAKD